MSGVRAGSGGSGIRPGSQGSGVAGGGGIGGPVGIPLGIGGDTSTGTTTNEHVTGSFTAAEVPGRYYLGVSVGFPASSLSLGSWTVTGMGTTWARQVAYYYDASGGARSGHFVFVTPYLEDPATDGALTITRTGGNALSVAVSLIFVPGYNVGYFDDATYATEGVASPLVGDVPAGSESGEKVFVLFTNMPFISQVEATLDGDLDVLATSGAQSYSYLQNYWGVLDGGDSAPADLDFVLPDPAYSGGYTAFRVSGNLGTYAENLTEADVTMRFPLQTQGTGTPPVDYATEIAEAEYDTTLRFPLESSGAGVVTFPTPTEWFAANNPATTLYSPGAKGAGSDPDPYATTLATYTPTTQYTPGAKGVGPVPATYASVLTAADPDVQYNEVINAADQLPSYNTIVAELVPDRHFEDSLVAPLEETLLGLSPVSYWRLNDASSPATDQGSLANNAPGNGALVWADTAGPDGESYPTFDGSATCRIEPGDANEYSINTTDGTTMTICFKPTAWTDAWDDEPLLLGKFKVSDNEWLIKFTGTADGTGLEALVHNTGQATGFVKSTVSGASAKLNSWNTLVVVFPSGDTPPVLYLNDDTALTVTEAGPTGTREPDNTGSLFIGGSTSSAGSFTGSIAHVAVIDTAISGANVTAIMDSARADGFIETEMSIAIKALSPVGYWKMDDYGTDIYDDSGNGLDGTANADTIPHSIAGPDGNYYHNLPNDDSGVTRALVTIPGTGGADFSPTGHGVTVVALMKPLDGELAYTIMKREAPGDGTEWNVNMSSGAWRSDIQYSGNDGDAAFNGTQTDDEWQLVVIRFPDQASGNAIPEGFFSSDTEAVASSSNLGTGTFVANPDATLFLGGFNDDNYYGMNGGMAHVAVFNTALSDADIGTIYDAAVADGWVVPPTVEDAVLEASPDSYWKLDDATTTAVDSGSLGNDGTFGASVSLQTVVGPDGSSYPEFSGSTPAADLLTISHNAAYLSETGAGLTVMALVKSDDVDSYVRRNIILKDGSWWLRRFNDQPIFGNALSNNDTGRQRTGAAALTQSEWSLIIATTVDNTTFPDMYVDGAELGGSDSGSSDGSTAQTGNITVGGSAGSYDPLDGSIAHLAIWDRVLTSGEIEAIESAAISDGWITA